MTEKIYKVIAESNFKELLAGVKKQSGNIEIRADYAQISDIKQIDVIAAAAKNKKTIFTLRSAEEGGKFKGKDTVRLSLLKHALKQNFSYVDIEFAAAQKNKISFTPAERKKLILSYHNFKRTPPPAELGKINKQMLSFRPAAVKIAAMAKQERDIVTLTRFLIDNIECGQPAIVIAMGKRAAFTRLLFPLLGSFAGYAPSGKATAPGQINIEDFARFL